MAEFITGDAFKEDRISEKIYGLPITSGNHSVTFSGKEETPEPMCNTVSFMKTETLNSHCRNVVAVSESYICYTVKKTKLRAIHTESSKLALFQGHDFPLVDLKFSQVDRSFLCSVDDSIGAELPFPVTPRVIIRQLKFDLELTSTVLAQFPISATMVDPHPKIAHVFAIAKGNRVGVVSGMQKIGGKDSWDGLTLNTIMPANITDISFSTDGTQLVVVTAANGQSDVAIISLPGMEQLSLGEGKLVKSEQRRLHAETVWSDILSVICLPCGILTASRVASVSESAIKGVRTVQLQLLSTDSTTGYMDIIQSIKVTIPVHSSASIDESNNDIKLAFKKRVGDGTDFVILCHRSSHILACIAVDVRRRQLPLCHLTFFDLKWPVFSLDSTIISGRNYYSDEEVDHLEIACYQVQDSKHAVHQYHFHCSSLYSIEATEHESEKNSNMTRKFSGQSILEILKTPSHIVSADSFSSESYATSSNFDIPVGTVRPVTAPRLVENIMKSGSISEELVWSEIEAKNAQTQINRSSHQTVESEQKELPPLPEILRSNAVQGRSIMSMLTKLNTVKTAEPVLVASTAALVPASLQAFIPVPVSTRVSASIPTITSLPNSIPDVTTSAPVARVSDSNESSKSDVSPGTVARLMSGLYETLFTEVIPVSEVQVPASTIVVVTPTQQRSETVEFEVVAIEQDEEDDWQDASAAVAMTARRSPLTAPTLVGRDALDLALQKSKIQVPSQQQSFGQQSYHVDTSLHDKINDLTKGMYSLVECVSDIKSSTASTTTNRISQLFDQLDAKTAKRDIEAKQEVERAIKSLRSDMINEMKSALDASFIKSQREMQAFKAEIVAVSISHAKENTLAITKTVKSILDSEMKKSIEVVSCTLFSSFFYFSFHFCFACFLLHSFNP